MTKQQFNTSITEALDNLHLELGLITEKTASDTHEETSLVNSIVLVKCDSTNHGPSGQRVEAFVLAEYENSVKLRFKDKIEGYYTHNVISDNLGPATDIQYRIFGVKKPEAPPTPNYQTGTYVAPTQEGLFLVEVDKVGNNYYIHYVDSSALEPLTPEIWDNIDKFSDPDGPGDYVLAPGPYYVEKLKRMIEVIPHGGYSYYRFINSSKLTRLTHNLAQDCARVESDTFEVNAIMVMPQDTPKDVNPQSLENAEDRPTGCCQATPREEPVEA